MLQLVNEICKSFSRVRLYLTKPFGGRYPGLDPENLAKFEWSCDAIYTYPMWLQQSTKFFPIP